jgi:nicotinamide mononucleotide transporter
VVTQAAFLIGRPLLASEPKQQERKRAMRTLFRTDVLVGSAVSVLLLGGSLTGTLAISLTEVLGFLTGGLSVWLVVKGNIWTWPVGIANNVFFALLFWDARLYGDMALQGLYVVLNALGLWFWLRRDGAGRRPQIGRVHPLEAAALLALAVPVTWAPMVYLRHIHGSAPFLDALTTCGSIVATYLLARKLIESWFVWIAVDVVYVPLYLSRELVLTAVLYAGFLLMCVLGLAEWRRELRPAVLPAAPVRLQEAA